MLKKDFSTKILHSIKYSIVEKIFDIIISLLSSIIVTRYLARESYGIISYAASYMIIFNIINIAPENYLFKEYNRLKKDVNNLNECINSFLKFNIIKGFILFFLNIVVGLIVWVKTDKSIFLIVMISNGLVYLLNQLSATIRVVFEVDFNQKAITKIFLIAKMFRFMISLLLIIFPSIYIVLLRDLLFCFIQSVLFYFYFISNYKQFKIKYDFKYSFVYIKKSLFEYSIWTHFTGVITNFIYGIDPFILGFFVSMIDIGNYSIALNSSNYFIILFQVLQKNTSIALANITDESEENEVTTKFFIVSIFFAIMQFLGFVFFGKYYLSLFVTDSIDIIYLYSFYIVLGVTIVNSIRPLSIYLILKYDAKKYFLYSTLPSGIFTIILYFCAAYNFGTIGIAKANVLAYIFWLVTQIILLKKSSFKLTRIQKRNII